MANLLQGTAGMTAFRCDRQSLEQNIEMSVWFGAIGGACLRAAGEVSMVRSWGATTGGERHFDQNEVLRYPRLYYIVLQYISVYIKVVKYMLWDRDISLRHVFLHEMEKGTCKRSSSVSSSPPRRIWSIGSHYEIVAWENITAI